MRFNIAIPFRLILNLVLVYACYIICQIAFTLENLDCFQDPFTARNIWNYFVGGLHYDTAAICYYNLLFIILYLAVLFIKRPEAWYLNLLKWLFIGVNGICVIMNLADSAFFRYRLKRSTSAIFSEFGGDGNILKITGTEMLSHWYFVLLVIILIVFLWRFYRQPLPPHDIDRKYCITNGIACVVLLYLTICGTRGNFIFEKGNHPISINYAFRYTDNPAETGIVLNTPFTIIRTIGKKGIPTPEFFATQEELDAIYTPLHIPRAGKPVVKKNIVLLIVERFSMEYVGALNRNLDNGKYKGYTPYFDEMLDSCMWFDEMIANTAFSIDASPAVLASIPRGDTPFVLSPYSVNNINSLATELKNLGYTSSFFLGAQNNSMGICDFIRQAGVDHYFGLDEFYADGRFGGEEEYDGTWGIWDETFLQFFCKKLSEMPQPFLGSLFTLTSHHPYKLPEKYKDTFKENNEVHSTIRYTDYSLHRFFEEAKKQPWFNNTIFVLFADHTDNHPVHKEYKNMMGNYRVPVVIYDPSGELPRGRQPGFMQHIDIMPTLLNHIGYDRPYIAFGKDVLNTAPEDSWAFNWCYQPTYFKGDYMMVSDGQKITGMFNFKSDPLQKDNLLGKGLPEEHDMELHLKAILQSYLSRMNNNDLTLSNPD